jgi:sugar-specific transcriptional regulator TrmB
MLEPLGLSRYEDTAYVALVRNGLSSAHELAKHSSVPYGKIYPVLAALERKGFVKIYPGRPQRFMAIEPQVAVQQAVRQREAELASLRKRAEVFVSELGTLAARKPAEPLESVRIIEGYQNYLGLSVELHRQAHREWRSISELSLYKPHIDAYRDCARRGLQVRILTSSAEATPEKLAIWRKVGAVIRLTDFMPTKFSVVDDTDVTIRIADRQRYVSLWLRNPSFARSMQKHFDALWKAARPA